MPSAWEEQQKHFFPACEKSGHSGVATDNSLTMFPYGLGMLRVVLNCGIFGLVVHIL